jgi:hypothetical protein
MDQAEKLLIEQIDDYLEEGEEEWR